MNSKLRTRTVGGFLLAVSFLFGIGMVSSATVQAQDRSERNRRDGNWDRNRDDRNRNRNYRSDRRRWNRDDNWDRNRRSNNVYRGGNYGNYGSYGQYGRSVYGNGGYNQAAVNQGYQNGLYTGSRDAQRGQSYNPQRSHFYKDANSQAYRQGFLRGYQQGFQQYGGYNNSRYNNQRWPW